jgi:hypothetical protein
MSYLSGSILLSVRLRMDPTGTTPGQQRHRSAGFNPPNASLRAMARGCRSCQGGTWRPARSWAN